MSKQSKGQRVKNEFNYIEALFRTGELNQAWSHPADAKRILRRLVRDVLMRDWEINGAHQGPPSREYMTRIARELIP